jgi:hypothetical protein
VYREGRFVHFHAKYVTASANGDYYQVLFESKKDTCDPDYPYFLIQRQFETPDGGRCYLETHDERYIGHFRIRRVDLSPSRVVVEIDRPMANVIEVTFTLSPSDFRRVAQVVDIISGAIDPHDPVAL